MPYDVAIARIKLRTNTTILVMSLKPDRLQEYVYSLTQALPGVEEAKITIYEGYDNDKIKEMIRKGFRDPFMDEEEWNELTKKLKS